MSRKLTTQEFITEAIKTHKNKYGYWAVTYINARTKVKIYCYKCKKYFYQTPDNHLKHGCFDCGIKAVISKRAPRKNYIPYNTGNLSDFIKRANKIHNFFYDYSFSIYITMKTKLLITCPVHGNFWQCPEKHLIGHGCPICKKSKGELIIEKWLRKNKHAFKTQHSFQDCIGIKKTLPFDFYLPDINTCIEFDGRQHFEPVDFSRGGLSKKEILKTFKQTQNNDNTKTNYCKSKNIKLIRISYKQFNNINNILKKSNLITSSDRGFS